MSYTPRVLVVDDEPVVIKSCDRILSSEGMAVEGAATGSYGLELTDKGRFDAMVLDLRIPDTNGIEILRRVKQTKPELEVVIITGYPSVNTAVEALKLGACDYVVKPFTPEEITDAVRNALKQRGRVKGLKEIAAEVSPKAQSRPTHFAGMGRSMRTTTRNGTRIAVIGLSGAFAPESGVFPALIESLKRMGAPLTAVYGSHEVEGKEILGYLEDNDKIVVVTRAQTGVDSQKVARFKPGELGCQGLATQFVGFPQVVNWAKAVGIESGLVVIGVQPEGGNDTCVLGKRLRQELVAKILAELS